MKKLLKVFAFSALIGVSYPVMAQTTESGTTTTTTRTEEDDNDDHGKWGLLGLAGLLGLIPKKKHDTVVRTTGTTHNR
ncbi:MAG: hypothetical protein JWP88_2326 [Flaviaesturariibacter sp.]|nr:hypothetical protein [Flaviaesturariibacter sp.]